MDAASSGFVRPNDEDQRGWLWVVTILSIIYSLTFFAARVFVKYGQLGWDDTTLGIAYVIAAVRWGLSIKSILLGLGAHVEDELATHSGVSRLLQLTFASRILLLTCHWLAKCSVAVFTRRLFSGDMNHEMLIFTVVFAALATSGIAAVLVSSVAYETSSLVTGPNERSPESSHSIVRWVVACALDAVSELVLLAYPLFLLLPIQMARTKKRKVWIYYSFRIGVIVLSIMQTVLFVEFVRHGRTSIGLGRPLILQDLLLCYSLISATIPCMRTFVGAFAGHSLTLAGDVIGTGVSNAQSESYRLHSIGRRTLVSMGPEEHDAAGQEQLKLRPGSPVYNVSVEHRRGSRSDEQISIGSDGSEQLIIRRDTHVYVERDG